MATYSELSAAIDEVGEVPCHSAPDLFFMDEETSGFLTLLRYAREMCSDCPVRNLCASYAIDANETHGIWGGMSPFDRKTIRRKRGMTELVEEPESLVS